MTPACHNRQPRLAERTRHGISSETGLPVSVTLSNGWFTDRCAIHDGRGIGPNGESYPGAHGFDCRGCRWLPEGLA